jgi:hypothetical protein
VNGEFSDALVGDVVMRTNLARNDDLPLRDFPTRTVEIKGAPSHSAPSKFHFLSKLFLVFVLLMTLCWNALLGWALVRVLVFMFL